MNVTVTHQVSKMAKCKDCGTVTKSTRDAGTVAGWEMVKTEQATLNAFGAMSLWQCARDKAAAVPCRKCGSRNTTSRKIVAKHSDTTECNDKCMGATGPACECQCDGKNHGGSYAA